MGIIAEYLSAKLFVVLGEVCVRWIEIPWYFATFSLKEAVKLVAIIYIVINWFKGHMFLYDCRRNISISTRQFSRLINEPYYPTVFHSLWTVFQYLSWSINR